MTISVIIPVYNVRPYLDECLDSVIAAAGRVISAGCGVSVIAVDDGSTDGSGAFLDAYAGSGRLPAAVRMRVVHQRNAGVSAARNRGLEMVTGDWVLFVDGDDFVRPSWLETVVRLVGECSSADLVGFGKLPFYGEEKWPETDDAPVDVGIDRQIPDTLVGHCVYQFAYSARLAAGLRFLPLAVGEDLVFTAQAYAAAGRCVVTGRPEYGYRYRDGSATHSGMSCSRMMDVIRFNVEMFKALDSSGKRVGAAFSEGRGGEWLVSLPRRILRERSSPGGGETLAAWFDSLEFAAGCRCLSAARRNMARRIAARRTVPAVWLFCLLPAWIGRRMQGLGLSSRRSGDA